MKRWKLYVATLAVALPGLALAQGGRGRMGEPREPGMDRDISVLGQAGIVTYSGEAARLTNPGATYGVNLGVDVTRGINAELGYQGSVYRTEAGLTPDQSSIVENGGQALLKVGPEMGKFHPYAAGGLSVMRLNVTDEIAAGPEVQDDTLVRLPLGLGFNYKLPSTNEGDLTLGARATYNLSLDSGAFPTIDNATAASQVAGQVMIGGTW